MRSQDLLQHVLRPNKHL